MQEQTLGTLIRNHAKREGISLRSVARQAGVPWGTFGRYTRDQLVSPDFREVAKLVPILGIPLEVLVCAAVSGSGGVAA